MFERSVSFANNHYRLRTFSFAQALGHGSSDHLSPVHSLPPLLLLSPSQIVFAAMQIDYHDIQSPCQLSIWSNYVLLLPEDQESHSDISIIGDSNDKQVSVSDI